MPCPRDSLPCAGSAFPIPKGYENGPAQKDLKKQADKIVRHLKEGSVEAEPDKEIIALIAYLQRLGVDIKSAPEQTAAK